MWKIKRLKINKKDRQAILDFLKKIEEKDQDTVYYLNLFNSGFVVGSEHVKNILIRIIRGILRYR